MEPEFKEELEKTIPKVLVAENLVQKKINGKEITAMEYFEYVEQYFKLFKSNQMPEPKTIYESTVEKQLTIIVDNCFNRYKELLYSTKHVIKHKLQLPILHKECKKEALKLFNQEKKMGNASKEKEFKSLLKAKIESLYDDWKSNKESSIQIIEEEMEKTRVLIEEKEKIFNEQLKAEKEAKLKLEALQAQKERQLREESEKKIQEEREKAELLRKQSEKKLKEEMERKRQEELKKAEEEQKQKERELREEFERLEAERDEEIKIVQERLKAEEERSENMKKDQEYQEGFIP